MLNFVRLGLIVIEGKYGAEELNVNWLEWLSLWEAIPDQWLAQLNVRNMEQRMPLFLHLEQMPLSLRNRKIYEILVDDKETTIIKYYNRWNDIGLDFGLPLYTKAFLRIDKMTKVSKLRDFQYRLLLGKIICNEELLSWGIKESNLCTFCERGNRKCGASTLSML